MEREFVMRVNMLKKLDKSRVPRERKRRPQKRRAVIRVESAETQDYVSESQGLEEIDDEEMEEMSLIPSAVSAPRWALHMCDNKCNTEGFKFYQPVAIVVEDGGAHDQPVQSMFFMK